MITYVLQRGLFQFRRWLARGRTSGQRRSVRTADTMACTVPVGFAVRTNDLAVSAVAGIMAKASDQAPRHFSRQ